MLVKLKDFAPETWPICAEAHERLEGDSVTSCATAKAENNDNNMHNAIGRNWIFSVKIRKTSPGYSWNDYDL